MTMNEKHKLKAYLAFAAVSFFWGTTYLAIRIGVETVPPALFAGLRFLMAGCVFMAFLKGRGYALPKGRDILDLSVTGVALLALANGSVVWAEQHVPSSLAALIVATLPFWMVGIESVLPRGERVTLRQAAGIVTGFFGLVLLLWPEIQGSIDALYLKGILALFFAPLSWSAGSIYAKRHKLSVHPLMSAAAQMLVAGSLLTLFGFFTGELGSLTFDLRGMAAMVYLAIFGSIVGYGSYIYMLDKLPSSFVATYAYLNPVVAVLLGWLILDERFDWLLVIATVVILLGVVLVTTDRPRRLKAKRRNPVHDASATPPACLDEG